MEMSKSSLKTAVALGATVMITTTNTFAAISYYDWDGMFTMLDTTGLNSGDAVANTSISAAANQSQTPISGTMAFDHDTGAGTATLVPFDFLNASLPAEVVGIKIQAIGDGAGGPGSLILGNMLFNLNGSSGMPLSLVMDAAGFFTGSQNGDMLDGVLNGTDVAAYGAIPASDGTYVGISAVPSGYLNMGPVPIATTEFNTTNINSCVYDGCIGNGSSGGLPLITDTTVNANELESTPDKGNGIGIGGSPMQDGPYQDFSLNLDFTELRLTGSDDTVTIVDGCTFDLGSTCSEVSAVPIPAAVWLFGSGLLGLVGVARRKKA